MLDDITRIYCQVKSVARKTALIPDLFTGELMLGEASPTGLIDGIEHLRRDKQRFWRQGKQRYARKNALSPLWGRRSWATPRRIEKRTMRGLDLTHIF